MTDSLIFRSLGLPGVQAELDPLGEGHPAEGAEGLQFAAQRRGDADVEVDKIISGVQLGRGEV
jgi:hypothetical protein